MKTQILKSLALTTFIFSSTVIANTDDNPNLLIFAGHLRNYAVKAQTLHQMSSSDSKTKDPLVEELKMLGTRLGRIYFAQSSETIQTELNKHLSEAMKKNQQLKSYFVFMGNAFADEASRLLLSFHAHQKQVKVWSIAGGLGLGLLAGGGYLVIQSKHLATLSTAGRIGTKEVLIATALVAGGTAIGFGVGTLYSAKIPMDSTIKNAKDFSARYPHGVDFVKDLSGSQDLAFLVSELQNQ